MDHVFNMINEMVIHHTLQSSLFNIANASSAVFQLKEFTVPEELLPTPTRYCDYIDKMISQSQFSVMTIDKLILFYDRFTDNSIVNGKQITIQMREKEDIEKIRPEYLNNIPVEFDRAVREITKGTMKHKDVKALYATGDYFTKVRKQLAKTSIRYTDTRDLMTSQAKKPVVVTGEYIANTVIPFIKEYPEVITHCQNIGFNLKTIIENTDSQMRASIAAIDVVCKTADIKTERLLTYLKYNMYRNYLDLCTYATALYMRMTSYYSYNMMVYLRLATELEKYMTESEMNVIESYMGSHLSDITDDEIYHSMINNRFHIVVPHLNHLVEVLQMDVSKMVPDAKVWDLVSEDAGYDMSPYIMANKATIAINESLEGFIDGLDYNSSVIDDVLDDNNLSSSFISTYESVLSGLVSHDFYESGAVTHTSDLVLNTVILKELQDFEKNAGTIASNLSKCSDKISYQKQYMSDPKNISMDEVSYKDFCDAFAKIETDFKDYVTVVGKRLISRLNMLVDMATPADDFSIDPTKYEAVDYTESTYMELYDDIINTERDIMESIHKEFMVIRANKETGAKLVFEADEPQPQQNANKEQSASVQTDAKTQTQTGNDGNPTEKKAIVERFREFIDKIVEKFRSVTQKLTKKNDAWVGKVKSSIEGMSYDNTTINVAPYTNATIEKIISDINSAADKINGISASNIPSNIKTRNGAEAYIFGAIPAKIGRIEVFKDRIYQFYVFGNTESKELQSVKGEDAKTKASNMITFCENYSRNVDSLSQSLKKLSDNAAKKQQEIINALGTQNVKESTFTEAEASPSVNGAQKEATNEKLTASSTITTVVREYTAQVMTIMEKKYLDYIKILDGLAPSKEAKPEKEPEAEASNEGNPEQV